MGIPDSYQLPASYNDAYQLAGDGVAVPVVRWLSKHLLLPILAPTPGNAKRNEVEFVYA
jgi:DNA (cytosine-5)-methyltransferase 1